MSELDRCARAHLNRQRGVYAVEFALVALIFFLMVFGIVEFARMLYVFNTVQEVTRIAASATVHENFRNTIRLQQIREASVLRSTPGVLPLGAPISDQHVRIEFLASFDNGSGKTEMHVIPENQLPSCPMNNRHICMANPNASNCVRYVRARICEPGNQAICEKAQVTLMIPMVSFTVEVPHASFVLPVESLGYMPNMAACP